MTKSDSLDANLNKNLSIYSTTNNMDELTIEESFKKSKNSVNMSSARPSQADILFERDPFNKPEHIITLKGKELVIFVIGYIIAVVLILTMFECLMPVIFTNEYYGIPSKE
uniref:GrBNV_gp95-like protein n=1 Tax=Parastrongyloides trichosuri TaxID=131310 RepID=A0A0N4Z7U2_PARTI